MFWSSETGIGLSDEYLWSGEGHDEIDEDELAYLTTCRQLAGDPDHFGRHTLPDLDQIPVGPFLAAVVSTVDVTRMSGHDLVRLMKARARLASHEEAGKLAAMAEIAFCPPADPADGVIRVSEELEYAALEIAAALSLTRRSSERELSRAVSLRTRLRRVWDRFASGLLDPGRIRVFDHALGHLPEKTVDSILDRVLDDATELTTGQLRARLWRLVLEYDPDGSAAAFEEGVHDRKVVTFSNPDHTANLGIYSAEPDRVAAARDYIESLARSLKTADEPRTLDQLRADVALDLLTGRHLHEDGSGGGRTNITVPAETLARLSDLPGDLDGYGPVFAEIARKTVRENIDGEWVFTVTDQGRPVATGTLSRRPTESQKRQIRAQYETCVFPGCRMPAYQCDLDHRRPHSQGGPTHNDNVGPLCRHHHMGKHHAHWLLLRKPNGDHVWTSPLGHTYIRKRAPPEG